MQRMGGGGNDPSCGCDMQAGWPPASTFPRGGLQGGGNWNFNEFNLALTKNGKTRHLKGKWNNGMNSVYSNNSNRNSNNSNKNNNTINMNSLNSNGNINNKNGNTNNNNNNKKNNKKNNKTKKNNKKTPSSAKKLKNIMYQGKVYQTNNETGDTFQNGKYVGKYIRPNNGAPYLEMTPETPEYGPKTPPYTPETPEYGPQTPPLPEEANNNNNNNTNNKNNNNNNKNNKNNNNTNTGNYDEEPPKEKEGARLSQEGGRRRRKTRKHGKRCPCFLCMFKKLRFTAKRR